MPEGLGWEPLDLTASDCNILDMLDRCPWVRLGPAYSLNCWAVAACHLLRPVKLPSTLVAGRS